MVRLNGVDVSGHTNEQFQLFQLDVEKADMETTVFEEGSAAKEQKITDERETDRARHQHAYMSQGSIDNHRKRNQHAYMFQEGVVGNGEPGDKNDGGAGHGDDVDVDDDEIPPLEPLSIPNEEPILADSSTDATAAAYYVSTSTAFLVGSYIGLPFSHIAQFCIFPRTAYCWTLFP